MHHRLLDREHRSDGRPHRRFDHRRAGADAHRQGIPGHARRLDRGLARNRGRDRRIERAVRGQSGRRADGGDRNEPAGLPLVALASKATGFPIAKVAAKLAVGYTLDEIANDITGGATPASFEPTIDYIVTKIPRFAFEKFPGAEPTLTTAMKSVGEAMAIGRTFAESLQKALRSLETGLDGLDEIEIDGLGVGDDHNALRAAIGQPTPDRLLKVAQAMRLGMSVEEIHDVSKIDPWFLDRIADIVRLEGMVRAHGLPPDSGNFRALKAAGFSDARLAALAGLVRRPTSPPPA